MSATSHTVKKSLKRWVLVGHRKNQIFVFDRANTPVSHARKCVLPGQQLVRATITFEVITDEKDRT